MLAIAGFATPSVVELAVDQDAGTRRVPITSRVGAFVVVTVGVSDISVSAHDADREVLGTRKVFEGLRPRPAE
jgi:hypothetical protein